MKQDDGRQEAEKNQRFTSDFRYHRGEIGDCAGSSGRQLGVDAENDQLKDINIELHLGEASSE